jgi:glycosyltransferase involved in cell wall biosynthesis
MRQYSSLLSICIITYNRANIINENLDALCPVMNKYNIPIFISDNASSDNTEEVIKKFVKKYRDIYYFRQEINVGPDRNCEFIMKQTDTEYIWLIGDKVKISEDALIGVLNDLKSNDYDAYVVNSVIRHTKIEDKIYICKNELLAELGWHMTYLGCLIYNKKIIDVGGFKRYYNSRFLQTGIAFEYFDSHGCYVKMNTGIKTEITHGILENHWSNMEPIDIFCKCWFLFVMSLPIGYTYEAKRKCILDHGNKSELFLLMNILVLRMKDLFSMEILSAYKYFIKQTISCPFVVLFCIACIPCALLKAMRYIKKIIKVCFLNPS